MIHPTRKVGKQPDVWRLFILRLRKLFQLRYLLMILILLILLTYLRLINHVPSDQSTPNDIERPTHQEKKIFHNKPRSNKCNSDEIEFLLSYTSVKNNYNDHNDKRPQPTIERLHQLFQILIDNEHKHSEIFDYLDIFRFTDIHNTLRPFANNTQRLDHIYCLFQRYINVSDNGHVDIAPSLIDYLKQVSSYLSDGYESQHLNWNITSKHEIQKPVIILAANTHFYDTLQASMRTVNTHLMDYKIVIYDLGFKQNQLEMVRYNQ